MSTMPEFSRGGRAKLASDINVFGRFRLYPIMVSVNLNPSFLAPRSIGRASPPTLG